MHDKLYDIENPIAVDEAVGGHAAVWATRAQLEKCKAYVTPPPSDYYIDTIRRNDLNNGADLVLPIDKMEVSDTVNLRSNQDVHLVFEYTQGDQILGVVAPRSNRFYFVDDPNGASFTQLEQYHEVLDKVAPEERPYRHLFGGY